MFVLEIGEDCNDFCLPSCCFNFSLFLFIFSLSHFFPSQTKRGTNRLSLQNLCILYDFSKPSQLGGFPGRIELKHGDALPSFIFNVILQYAIS
jgi:hypothetical protein